MLLQNRNSEFDQKRKMKALSDLKNLFGRVKINNNQAKQKRGVGDTRYKKFVPGTKIM